MRYRGNSTVTIATMDISQNDGEIDVFQEVPTFKMFTADNKVTNRFCNDISRLLKYGINRDYRQVYRFNDTRTAQAIQEFIDTNGESETDVSGSFMIETMLE